MMYVMPSKFKVYTTSNQGIRIGKIQYHAKTKSNILLGIYNSKKAVIDIDFCHDQLGSNVVYSRMVEFYYGRWCTSKLMLGCGYEGKYLERCVNRAPVYPNGLSGSISHSENIIITAISKCIDTHIGIDVEKVFSKEISVQLESLVYTRDEHLLLSSGIKTFNASTLIFSAKESIYKAVYSKLKVKLDFGDISISSIDINAGEIEASAYGIFHSLKVHFILTNKFVFTICRIN